MADFIADFIASLGTTTTSSLTITGSSVASGGTIIGFVISSGADIVKVTDTEFNTYKTLILLNGHDNVPSVTVFWASNNNELPINASINITGATNPKFLSASSFSGILRRKYGRDNYIAPSTMDPKTLLTGVEKVDSDEEILIALAIWNGSDVSQWTPTPSYYSNTLSSSTASNIAFSAHYTKFTAPAAFVGVTGTIDGPGVSPNYGARAAFATFCADPATRDTTIIVRDNVTLDPIESASISVPAVGLETTNSYGLALLEEVLPGYQIIVVNKSGYLYTTDGYDLESSRVIYLSNDTDVTSYPGCIEEQLIGPGLLIQFATIALDADGISPTNLFVTKDLSPTIEWEFIDGYPPYWCDWELRDSTGQNILQSGNIADPVYVGIAILIPLSVLEFGEYRLRLHTRDIDARCPELVELIFSVVSSQGTIPDPIETPPPPVPVDLITPIEFRPVDPLGPGFIHYYPRWHITYGKDGLPGSDFNIFKLVDSVMGEAKHFNINSLRTASQNNLVNVPVSLPRLGWYTTTRYTSIDTVDALVRLDGGTPSVLRRCTSLSDFFYTPDRVYAIDSAGRVVFRNLCLRSQSVTPDYNNRFILSGEPLGIVDDADITYSYQGNFYWLDIDSGSVDPRYSIIKLPAEVTGSTEIRYLSEYYKSKVEVKINDDPWKVPTQLDFWNKLDEIGIRAGFGNNGNRRFGESNVNYKKRLQARLASPVGTTINDVVRRSSEELALTYFTTWTGEDTLDLIENNYLGVTNVEIIGLQHTVSEYQELLPSNNSGIYTGFPYIWDNYLIYVNGRVVNSDIYPGLTVTNNRVDFGANLGSAVVTANISSKTYNIVRNISGFVESIEPIEGNTPTGFWYVILTRATKVFTADTEKYINNNLLDVSGLPTAAFNRISNELRFRSQTFSGKTSWRKSNWSDISTIHAPFPFDL